MIIIVDISIRGYYYGSFGLSIRSRCMIYSLCFYFFYQSFSSLVLSSLRYCIHKKQQPTLKIEAQPCNDPYLNSRPQIYSADLKQIKKSCNLYMRCLFPAIFFIFTAYY
jgi:hypothetical protein